MLGKAWMQRCTIWAQELHRIFFSHAHSRPHHDPAHRPQYGCSPMAQGDMVCSPAWMPPVYVQA
jgi:hypothetical protein